MDPASRDDRNDARLFDVGVQLEYVKSFTSVIGSINPNWTSDPRFVLPAMGWLEKIAIQGERGVCGPDDMQQISKKHRVEIVKEPMEALPAAEKEASPIPEDLPAAEEASPASDLPKVSPIPEVLPASDFAEALPVPEKEASPIPGDLPAVEEASVLPEEASPALPEQPPHTSYVAALLPKNRQKRKANLPASSLASLPAFNFGNGPPSWMVREKVVVDAMKKFFAEELEECAREILFFSDIFHAFSESFSIASGRDTEIFSQKCRLLLTSQFPFCFEMHNNQRGFVNVRRKLAH